MADSDTRVRAAVRYALENSHKTRTIEYSVIQICEHPQYFRPILKTLLFLYLIYKRIHFIIDQLKSTFF